MPLRLTDGRPPIPPADLILRVAPSFGAGDIEANLEAFDVQGLVHLQRFERALALVGRSFDDFDRLLDFGCGCGRFLRHLGPIADQVEVNGTDIDSEMIDWLRANVPYGRYEVAPHEPQLPYADQYFDLLINHSVFTHLDERMQDLWLGELQRISRPGALVLLTVHGTSSWNHLCDSVGHSDMQVSQWKEALESRGIVFVQDDGFIGSTHPDFYHSTFHAPWYIFEHWTRFFDLVAYLPDGSDSQDLVLLRRRHDDAQAAPPIRARASELARGTSKWSLTSRAGVRQLAHQLRMWRGVDPVALDRGVNMLRLGLYEQANRISVLAAELREEIEALRESRQSSAAETTTKSESSEGN